MKTIAGPSATCPSVNLPAPQYLGPEVLSAWQALAGFHQGRNKRFSSCGKVGLWSYLLSVKWSSVDTWTACKYWAGLVLTLWRKNICNFLLKATTSLGLTLVLDH